MLGANAAVVSANFYQHLLYLGFHHLSRQFHADRRIEPLPARQSYNTPMASDEPHFIFVYGTLKRGEERADRWPQEPRSVEPATTKACLYDIGPYPAIVEGDDVVLGELWEIDSQDMPETLRVLDEIECYGNEDVDLYVRRVVECRTLGGETRKAFTYFFAQPSQLKFATLVKPGPDGFCRWNRRT